jgi:hypothetical protein
MKRVGTRVQVMHGNAKQTGGGLKKKDLKYNKHGKIVSKKASANATKKMKGGGQVGGTNIRMKTGNITKYSIGQRVYNMGVQNNINGIITDIVLNNDKSLSGNITIDILKTLEIWQVERGVIIHFGRKPKEEIIEYHEDNLITEDQFLTLIAFADNVVYSRHQTTLYTSNISKYRIGQHVNNMGSTRQVSGFILSITPETQGATSGPGRIVVNPPDPVVVGSAQIFVAPNPYITYIPIDDSVITNNLANYVINTPPDGNYLGCTIAENGDISCIKHITTKDEDIVIINNKITIGDKEYTITPMFRVKEYNNYEQKQNKITNRRGWAEPNEPLFCVIDMENSNVLFVHVTNMKIIQSDLLAPFKYKTIDWYNRRIGKPTPLTKTYRINFTNEHRQSRRLQFEQTVYMQIEQFIQRSPININRSPNERYTRALASAPSVPIRTRNVAKYQKGQHVTNMGPTRIEGHIISIVADNDITGATGPGTITILPVAASVSIRTRNVAKYQIGQHVTNMGPTRIEGHIISIVADNDITGATGATGPGTITILPHSARITDSDEHIDPRTYAVIEEETLNIVDNCLDGTPDPYGKPTLTYLDSLKQLSITIDRHNGSFLTINDMIFSQTCSLGQGAFGQVCSYNNGDIHLAKKTIIQPSEELNNNKTASILLKETPHKKKYVIPFIYHVNLVLMPVIIPLDKFMKKYTPSFKTKLMILQQVIYNLYKLSDGDNKLYFTDLKQANIGIMKYSSNIIRCYLIDLGSLNNNRGRIIRPRFVQQHILYEISSKDIMTIALNYLIHGSIDDVYHPKFSILSLEEYNSMPPYVRHLDNHISLEDYYTIFRDYNTSIQTTTVPQV